MAPIKYSYEKSYRQPSNLYLQFYEVIGKILSIEAWCMYASTVALILIRLLQIIKLITVIVVTQTLVNNNFMWNVYTYFQSIK